MRTWNKRPREEAHLLNPAFCCVAISSACFGYREEAESGFPLPLVFMVLPIILHKATRVELPNSPRTSLPAWIQEHASARVQYHERLMALKPYTSEAIFFGVQHQWLSVENNGVILTNLVNSDINRMLRTLEDEARECILRSRFLGKWFATARSTETTMALWGICP